MTYQPNFKVPRIRCEAHLKWIRQQPCMICGNFATAHHLTIGPEGKARGLTAGDNWTLPLCSQHHLAGFPGSLHHDGDERRWWAAHGIDPIAAAQQLWQESQAHRSGHEMP